MAANLPSNSISTFNQNGEPHGSPFFIIRSVCSIVSSKIIDMPFLRSFLFLTLLLFAAASASSRQASGPGQDARHANSPTAANKAATDSAIEGARKLSQQGKYAEALTQLMALSTSAPTTKGLSHELGLVYYKKGEYLKAVQSFQRAVQENPQDNEAVQLMGLSYYLAGRPAQAIPLLEKMQGWFPEANVDASYILGICYLQTKAYPQARGAFAKMFGVSPESAASYLFTARMLFRQEFGPVAEEYAQKAVALDPKLPLAHFLLGELYVYQSKIAKAVDEFQKELEINPGYAAAYYKMADAETRVQKFDEAERLLQRSIWLDSTATGPYVLLGKVLQKKGETELAVRALQRSITMDPNNPIPHHLLGQCYRDLGRTEDADRELKLAESLQSRQSEKP